MENVDNRILLIVSNTLLLVVNTGLVYGFGRIFGMSLSAYYPFLLSNKFYIVIKNKKVQEKYIHYSIYPRSEAAFCTDRKDRNKMALMGIVFYVVVAIILIGTIGFGVFWWVYTLLNNVPEARSRQIYCIEFLFLAGFICILYLVMRLDFSLGLMKNVKVK